MQQGTMGVQPMADPSQQGMVQPMGGLPGMSMPGAGPGPVTPNEVMAQAEDMAQQLLAMPETIRKSQLIQLKKTNPMLHAQVRMKMENMMQQGAAQGVAMMRQQIQGGM